MSRLLLPFAALLLIGSTAFSQDPPTAPAQEAPDADTEQVQNADATRKELFKKFEESMSGIRMVGRFTVKGQGDDQPLKEEEYHIRSVSKLPNGDYWLFQARIQYDDHDLTLPLPIEVKWAGQTPVITLDNFSIPGLGTFGARVVIHDDQYAGTWSHGEVGGHLFGSIEKLEAEELQDAGPTDR